MPQDDPAYIHAVSKLNTEFGEAEDNFEQFLETTNDMDKAYRLMSKSANRKVGSYCQAYTLQWRLWQLCFQLRRKAIEEYNAELNSYTDPVQRGVALSDGLTKSVDERDESSEYRRLNQLFRRKTDTSCAR